MVLKNGTPEKAKKKETPETFTAETFDTLWNKTFHQISASRKSDMGKHSQSMQLIDVFYLENLFIEYIQWVGAASGSQYPQYWLIAY